MTDKPLFDKRLVFSDELIHGTFKNMCVKCPRVALGYANAQPPGRNKIVNTPPPGLTTWANALRLPGGGGGEWALLELTDALDYMYVCNKLK